MTCKLPLLAATGLTKDYGRHVALRDVDLTVCEGEVVCVVGPSGSGKTTLLRCLALLEQPSAGQIKMNGVCLASPNDRAIDKRRVNQRRADVGMVFQHFNLWPHMTVLGNLIEAPIRVRKMPRGNAIVQAEALLASVGLSEWRDAYPTRLSVGQQQRVAIVRALCMTPRVLLFDEPTSALDPELRRDVLVILRKLAQDGMTMVIVTHEMGFARKVCSRLVFMDAGEIIETGAPSQFFEAPATERARRFLAATED